MALVALLDEKADPVARTTVQPRQGLLGRPAVEAARGQILKRHVGQQRMNEVQARLAAAIDRGDELRKALRSPAGEVAVHAQVAVALGLPRRAARVVHRLARAGGAREALPGLGHHRQVALHAARRRQVRICQADLVQERSSSFAGGLADGRVAEARRA